MRCFLRIVLSIAPLAIPAWSQHWEVGASGGYGLYRDVSVTSGAVSGKTVSRFARRPVLSLASAM